MTISIEEPSGAGGVTSVDLSQYLRYGAPATGITSTTLGFFGVTPAPQPGPYTMTNVNTLRTMNADAMSTNLLADVLGTLLSDLKTLGVIG